MAMNLELCVLKAGYKRSKKRVSYDNLLNTLKGKIQNPFAPFRTSFYLKWGVTIIYNGQTHHERTFDLWP